MESPTSRLLSIDVARGLVMFTMVFVNDLASVPAAPAWMKHYSPSTASGMTFVDVVFPAFLFIVGMSVPLAFESRARRGESRSRTMFHVLLRTLQLLCIGVLMVNTGRYTPTLGPPAPWWKLGLYVFAILALIAPSRDAKNRWLLPTLKVVGIIGLLAIAIVFRAADGTWFRTSWWGILGLIGWAYLVCCIAVLASGNRKPILIALAAGAIALFALNDHGLFKNWPISHWLNIGTMLGTHGAIAITGAVLGSMFLADSKLKSPRARTIATAALILTCAAGAIALHHPWGINKNAATPAWALWSCAATALLWLLTYAIVDVAGLQRAAKPLATLGTAALLVYLLHPVLYALTDLTGMKAYWRWGQAGAMQGIGRSFLCALGLSATAVGFGRAGMRLKL